MSASTPKIPKMTRGEVVWGIVYLLFQMIFLPSLLGMLLRGIWPAFPSFGINLIYYSINFLIIVCIMHRYLKKDGSAVVSHLGRLAAVCVIGFVLYWIGNVAVSALIQFRWPEFFNVNDPAIDAIGRDNLMLTAIGTVVFVPTAEELLYRALTFGTLRRYNRILAYLVSVTVFCAIHVVGYIGHYEPTHLALCYVQYIPAGLVLAGAYEYSGSIYAPIAIHTAVNLIGILAMR